MPVSFWCWLVLFVMVIVIGYFALRAVLRDRKEMGRYGSGSDPGSEGTSPNDPSDH